MNIHYLELAGNRYPMCYSASAAIMLDEQFGGVENISKKLNQKASVGEVAKTVVGIADVLVRAGMEYSRLVGLETPAVLQGSIGNLISMDDTDTVRSIMAVIMGDSKREVEVEEKKDTATPEE